MCKFAHVSKFSPYEWGLRFQDFNICPNILHVNADVDADAGGIAIAHLH